MLDFDSRRSRRTVPRGKDGADMTTDREHIRTINRDEAERNMPEVEVDARDAGFPR